MASTVPCYLLLVMKRTLHMYTVMVVELNSSESVTYSATLSSLLYDCPRETLRPELVSWKLFVGHEAEQLYHQGY